MIQQQHPHPTKAVHSIRHISGIIILLVALLSIDLSSMPELIAILIYEAMILAAAAVSIHWIYIARQNHRTNEED